MTTDNESVITTKDTTPEVTVIKQRPITELITLDTFQDMTDAEVQSIIDFRVEMARSDAITTAQIQASIVAMNEAVEVRNQKVSESNDILKQLLTKELQLGTITDEDSEG